MGINMTSSSGISLSQEYRDVVSTCVEDHPLENHRIDMDVKVKPHGKGVVNIEINFPNETPKIFLDGLEHYGMRYSPKPNGVKIKDAQRHNLKELEDVLEATLKQAEDIKRIQSIHPVMAG